MKAGAAVALGAAVAPELVLETGLPFDEIKKRIGLLYAGFGVRHRALGHYLLEVDERCLHHLAGFRTVSQFAAATFGMSRRLANDLIRIERALRELPHIAEAFNECRVTWSKVRELVKVASPEHDRAWLARATELSIDELINEVRLAKPGAAPRHRDDRKGLPEIRLGVSFKLPPDVYAKREQVRRKLEDQAGRPLQAWEFEDAMYDLVLSLRDDGTAPGTRRVDESSYKVVVNAAAGGGPGSPGPRGGATVETDDGPVPIDEVTAETLACDGACIDAARTDREADRRVPEPLRQAVFARDGRRCRACRSCFSLQAHHVVPASRHGPTVIWNLCTLCRWCHALTHSDLIRIVGDDPATWRFLDAEGRDLHGPESSLAELLRGLGGEPERLVVPEPAPIASAAELPAELNAAWWQAHSELIRWNDRRGVFELIPGARAEAARRESAQCACGALGRMGIDELGLTPLRRSFLDLVRRLGPIGVHRIAAMLGASVRKIERFVEPHLFRLGLATATPAGRIALPCPGWRGP